MRRKLIAENNQPAAIFQHAQVLYADALGELERSKLRNSTEKARGATRRAADAPILAQTGELPEFTSNTSHTSQEPVRLANRLDGGESLVSRYYVRIGRLHGDCFYKGLCDPMENTEILIRETIDYIRDAERLASP